MKQKQTQRCRVVAKEDGEYGRDGLGAWDQHMQTRIDKQQGPTIYNRKLYSVSCD